MAIFHFMTYRLITLLCYALNTAGIAISSLWNVFFLGPRWFLVRNKLWGTDGKCRGRREHVIWKNGFWHGITIIFKLVGWLKQGINAFHIKAPMPHSMKCFSWKITILVLNHQSSHIKAQFLEKALIMRVLLLFGILLFVQTRWGSLIPTNVIWELSRNTGR